MGIENLPDLDDGEPVMLFGRDIKKIPCFKHSMLYGIYSGLATVLTTFMLTSRPMLASWMGLGSWMSVATVYMAYCRYNFTIQKYEINDIRAYLQPEVREAEESQDQEKIVSV